MAVDFHTHILPEIDDGSVSVQESLEMLGILSRQGVRCVALTPHFYANHDTPARFAEKRQGAYEKLTAALGESAMELRLGAEVHYFEGISDCDALEELAISGTGCILVEMPSPPWSERMLHELLGIYQKRGLTPIIAHIDRYIEPLRTHGIPERLAKLPVLVQANASFFIRRGTRSQALRLLRSGRIHLLGTDCHHADARRPNMDEALRIIEKKLGPDAIAQISAAEHRVLRETESP